MQLFVRTLDVPGDLQVSSAAEGVERFFDFTPDSLGALVMLQGHVQLIDLAEKTRRDLTPWPAARAELLARNAGTVWVSSNRRDHRMFDVWRITLQTGLAELDTKNPGDVQRWLIDPAFTVRLAVATAPGGGTEVRLRETAKSGWRAFITTGPEEALQLYDFTQDSRGVLMSTTISGDTARIIEKNLKSGTERVIAQSDKSDPVAVLLNGQKHLLQAVAFDVNGRTEWRSLDYTITADLDSLKADGGTATSSVVSVDATEQRWLIATERDVAPTSFAVFDRKNRTLAELGPKVETAPLLPMTSVAFVARDGRQSLSGYFTVMPAATRGTKWPLVVLLHDGPGERDSWGLRAEVQLLANRGYAVLQLNYRGGSSGFGKRFARAEPNRVEDVIDAVRWATQLSDAGVSLPAEIDAKRVAVVGHGLGGVTAIMALSSTPELFACGANLFGAVSPANADGIKTPLLVARAGASTRVKSSDVDAFIAALEKRAVSVSQVSYPDEAAEPLHSAPNRLDAFARLEAFLSSPQCLSGRLEPLPKEGRIEGSSAVAKMKP